VRCRHTTLRSSRPGRRTTPAWRSSSAYRCHRSTPGARGRICPRNRSVPARPAIRRVAVLKKSPVVRRQILAGAVRRADEEGWNFEVPHGLIYEARQHHPIAHGNFDGEPFFAQRKRYSAQPKPQRSSPRINPIPTLRHPRFMTSSIILHGRASSNTRQYSEAMRSRL